MFCPVSGLSLWMLPAFFLRGSGHLQYPWNNFFPGGNLTKWHSTWPFPGSGSNMSNLSFFPLFLPSSFQQEAFGCDWLFHVLSCFSAGWVVVAATFLFEGFRTSHIPLEYFLPWWKSHRMAFNIALSWKWLQHVQPFIFPSISSIFFSARSIWL